MGARTAHRESATLREPQRGLGAPQLELRLVHFGRAHVTLADKRLGPVELRDGPRVLGLVTLEREPLVAVVDDQERVALGHPLALADAERKDFAVRLRDQLGFALGLEIGREGGRHIRVGPRGGDLHAGHGALKRRRVGLRRRIGRLPRAAREEREARENPRQRETQPGSETWTGWGTGPGAAGRGRSHDDTPAGDTARAGAESMSQVPTPRGTR